MKHQKVMVFGTFDGIHEGHLDFFRQAREYGDYLIVIVGRDVNILKIKKHLPEKSEEQRFNSLKRCKLVDEARMGFEDGPYKIIEDLKPDVICLGYDQLAFTKNLKKEIKKRGLDIKIYRLKPFQPEKYHSSIINKK